MMNIMIIHFALSKTKRVASCSLRCVGSARRSSLASSELTFLYYFFNKQPVKKKATSETRLP